MDSSRKELTGYKIAVIAIGFFLLVFFPSQSVGSRILTDGEPLKQTKLVLGSTPPSCVNKCSGCTPCMAVLVPSPHHNKASSRSDESYYPLSWKCECKHKLFQP